MGREVQASPALKTGFCQQSRCDRFHTPSRLRQELQKLFDQLAAQDTLKNLSQTLFVERLTPHFIALNHIHPFHEGNGRAQTLFWRKIARGA
ncbi:MAG: Fic family protein [Acetobacter papayae]|uniref:Fic family protein n=1 Tax=Acetobacter papayae TaxID=1076592 RepID=UPI0039E7D81F